MAIIEKFRLWREVVRILPSILIAVVLSILGLAFILVTLRSEPGIPKLASTSLESEYKPPEKLSIDQVYLPQSTMVYRLKRTPVSAEKIKSLAGNLGLPDEPGLTQPFTGPLDYSDTHYGLRIARDKSAGDYRVKSTGEVVRILSDGEYDYHDPRTDKMDDGPAPSSEECKKIAIRFVKRTKLLPLPDVKLTATETGGEGYSDIREDGVIRQDIRVSSEIQVKIDYPDDPTGSSRAEIQIVKDGRVRYMTLQLPAVEPFHTYPLKDRWDILTALSTGNAFYNTDVPLVPISCKINSVRIYYTRNKDDLFIPMYYYKGENTTRVFGSRSRTSHGHTKVWGHMCAVKQRNLLPPKPWEPVFPPGAKILGD